MGIRVTLVAPALDHGVVGVLGVEIKNQAIGGTVVQLGGRAGLPVVHIVVGHGIQKTRIRALVDAFDKAIREYGIERHRDGRVLALC